MTALSVAYRFKPGRTFAQALVGLLVGSTVFDIDWKTALGGAALAGLVALLQIWAEGGEMLADDARVTGTLDYVGKRRDEDGDGRPDGIGV